MHLDGFEQLGVNIIESAGVIQCESTKLHGTEIVLDFPSVGATENIMLASCLADGVTHIKNVAREPEIKCLQDFLNQMGANITGAGSNSITIKGVKKLHDTSFKIIPDRIEAGTYLLMAMATKGEILIKDVIPEHIESLLHKMKRMNCKIITNEDSVYAKYHKTIKATNIKTMPYPGFPTDLQSQYLTLMTVAKGTSIIVESIFENRYKYVNELIRMGANITIEGNTAIVQGIELLKSATLEAKDLRGGAALIEAALMAEGKSEIHGIKYVERGYENIVEKLTNLGAQIIKI
ncbi:MAG: UDP-N-acetylglucosamine 1-carboxyvinyltransferase [Clostridia bacterium]|nr:UDP-N-acetylglucosamine 1-carboxyvinyltransferase [Clostridia bacterium]